MPRNLHSASSLEKFTLYGVLLLAVASIGVSLATLMPGYLSIDEITYHLMAKNFAESGSFEIWNGYREYPSAALIPLHLAVTVHDGGLVPQPPYFINLLGALFYRIAGLYGLFFLNILAFAGTIMLCYGLAQELFRDRKLAFNACLILGLATFSFEYAQAIWFHATVMCVITAAFYLFLRSFSAHTQQRAWFFALGTGLITGFAAGVRPDAIFILPGLLLPFLFLKKPWRPGLALTICLGTVPGLLALSITNYTKFEIFFPFSYGDPGSLASTYGLPFAGIGLIIVFGGWGITRYFTFIRAGLSRYRRLAIVVTVLILVGFALIPLVRQTVVKRVNFAYQILVDLRVRGVSIQQPALLRTSGGGMSYIGGLKKSLLQSCPYLVVLLFPLLKVIRHDREYISLSLLFLIPLMFLSFYAFSPSPETSDAWHGGLSLNMRYLTPIFPFTSLLVAYVWREFTRDLPGRWRRMLAILFFVTVGSYFFIVRPRSHTVERQEFVYLTLPLILASLLILLVVLRYAMRGATHAPWRDLVSLIVVAVFFVGLVWAGLVEFFYDYPLVRRTRKFNRDAAADAAGILADDSLLFSTFVDPFFGVIDQKRIRMANPLRDNFQDFAALTTFHIKQGRSVYAALGFQDWNWLKNSGPLDPDEFRIRRCHIFSHSVLCQILSKTPNDSDS